ncbi:hypothetical protein K388_05811 [Streptomyces sp. KhCrAH-43]|uniref:hypothetical protein n=1 Tax=unclassified Streptomyces TaxID=2593676 RepID=UPI00036C2710|nr:MULTISPECIES: hypothetical protein [unclassified Streptomyces]MYS33481.1 hypothetical protein [Streptomyces sp. SID4920]MYX63927.1 hypothetical protein [Streptomyces sp. SID8373]RAJ52712.1 hypothetical protein K388_05811 [Streptomyces sp. KhCrAH-43]
MTTLTAVDPPGCGCTECITGQYVPLDHATPKNITALLNGQLSNHTGVELRITVVYALHAETSAGAALVESMRIEYEELVWLLEPSDAASVAVTILERAKNHLSAGRPDDISRAVEGLPPSWERAARRCL